MSSKGPNLGQLFQSIGRVSKKYRDNKRTQRDVNREIQSKVFWLEKVVKALTEDERVKIKELDDRLEMLAREGHVMKQSDVLTDVHVLIDGTEVCFPIDVPCDWKPENKMAMQFKNCEVGDSTYRLHRGKKPAAPSSGGGQQQQQQQQQPDELCWMIERSRRGSAAAPEIVMELHHPSDVPFEAGWVRDSPAFVPPTTATASGLLAQTCVLNRSVDPATVIVRTTASAPVRSSSTGMTSDASVDSLQYVVFMFLFPHAQPSAL
jgi:hypothetical protein